MIHRNMVQFIHPLLNTNLHIIRLPKT
jgi:hypothetical protein